MNGPKILMFTLFFCITLCLSGCKSSVNETIDLKVSFISNIDNNPYFSWKTQNGQAGFRQSAYRILVSDDLAELEKGKGNVWDTGKQDRDNQQHSKYTGKQLQNGKPYFGKLQIWDQNGKLTSGEPVRFFVPIDYPEDWNAKWITYDYKEDAPLPVFRNTFKVDKNQISYLRLYISAPGFYEAYINGKKIGDYVLDPGQTNYEDYAFYTVYDIDPAVIKNDNVIGIMLGNGWYNQNVVWNRGMIYGQPVFICQLEVNQKDGTKSIVGSNETWKWTNGPIPFSNIYAGETYNANLEVQDWFDLEINESRWKKALLAETHPEELFEQFAEPIKIMDTLKVVNIIDKTDGTYIFDFGQNFTGWARLYIEGEKDQEITLRHVEVLDSVNNINPITTGIVATHVVQTSKYTCKGEGLEIWEPKFAYYGFRFVEVEGLNKAPTKDLLKGMVIYSAVSKTGSFSSSEENINKLNELANWTMIGNIQGVPTDCPHREKCGWTGDVQAYAQSLIYSYDVQKFLTKYMFDIRSSAREETVETYYSTSFYDRSPAIKPKLIPPMVAPGKRRGGIASTDWGTVVVQVPWYLYLYYGDSVVLREFYPDMKAWVNYIHEKKENGIIPHGLGDWCPPTGIRNIDCPVPISSTAFHILDVQIMKQASAIFGMEEDCAYYTDMLNELTHAFNSSFYDEKNHTYGSQTADAMALDLRLVPENDRKKVAGSIIKNINEKFDGFLSTGIFGLSRVFKALAENGYEEDAHKLLAKRGPNSFAYMWEAFDATTLWEVLPFAVYNLRSHSHPMQGGYDAWFYSGIAGINPSIESPGFKEIIFKPYLTRQLNSAEATHKSIFGEIKSSWTNAGGNMNWEISIPANSKGKIYVPRYEKKIEIKVNGKQINVEDYQSDFAFIGEFQTGNYQIETKIANQ